MIDSIRDLNNQAAYIRDLARYIDHLLGDLQGVTASGALTPHEEGIIYAATNRIGGHVRTNLEEAQRHTEAWAKEVRDAVNHQS